jgi:phage terminase large subunit-like protein
MPAIEWAQNAVAWYKVHGADRIVAEVNNGGDLVEANLRAAEGGKSVPYTAVHASRGKTIRAEPVSALYEQGRIHHVGAFPALEDQLCAWDSTGDEKSPDRLDALVWGLTHLMLASSAHAPADPRASDARRASFPKLRA